MRIGPPFEARCTRVRSLLEAAVLWLSAACCSGRTRGPSLGLACWPGVLSQESKSKGINGGPFIMPPW